MPEENKCSDCGADTGGLGSGCDHCQGNKCYPCCRKTKGEEE